MNHIPGPWIYDDTEEYYRGKVIRHNGVLICRMFEVGEGKVPPSYMMNANAGLMAAAPEMLEALRNLLTDFEKGGLTKTNLIIAYDLLKRIEGEEDR